MNIMARNLVRLRTPHFRGFTIIELLVVIGIIVLMIGLLLPALSKARETSRRTVCMSNLRQIGIGMQTYRDANGGRVPEAQTLPVDPHAPSIMSYLDPHLQGSKEIWECPSDEELFPQMGTSYEYFIGFYLTMIDVEHLNAAQRKNDLLRFFGSYPSMAFVMNDAEGFHARSFCS